ncbi:hypothetical protein GCM10027214_15670 [Stenotrophomonas tumulicola]
MPMSITHVPRQPALPTFGVEPRPSQNSRFAALVSVHNTTGVERASPDATPATFSPAPLMIQAARVRINAAGSDRNILDMHGAFPPRELLHLTHFNLEQASLHLDRNPDVTSLMDMAEQQAHSGVRTVTQLCSSHEALQAPERIRRLQMAALRGVVGDALRSPDTRSDAIHSLAPDTAGAARFDSNALRQLDPIVHEAVWLRIHAATLLSGGIPMSLMVDDGLTIKPGSDSHRYLQRLAAEHGEPGEAVEHGATVSGMAGMLVSPVDRQALETLERRAAFGLLDDRPDLSPSDLAEADGLGLTTAAGSEAVASPFIRWLTSMRNVDLA